MQSRCIIQCRSIKREIKIIQHCIVSIHLVPNEECIELYTHPLTFFHIEWCFKHKNLILLVTYYLCLFCLHEVLKQLHSLSRYDCCHTNKVKMYNLYMSTFLKCIHHTWIQFNILYFVKFGYNDKQKRKKSYKARWQMSCGHLLRKYTL